MLHIVRTNKPNHCNIHRRTSVSTHMLCSPKDKKKSTSRVHVPAASHKYPPPQKKMEYLFELPVEDMDMSQSSSQPSGHATTSMSMMSSHQASMCSCSYIPHDSVASLQLADLQDHMDQSGNHHRNGCPHYYYYDHHHHGESTIKSEMVVNNGGGLWSAHNKRPSVIDQGSFSEQHSAGQQQQPQRQHQQHAYIMGKGNGYEAGQSIYTEHPTCPITPVASNERPIKRQRVISRYQQHR